MTNCNTILLENQNYSIKIILGCSRYSCQYSWRLGYCKASGSFQEQSHYGFYWQGCENIWDWYKALIWLIANCWSHKYSTYFWPLFCILSIYIPLLAECEIITNKPEIKTFVFLSINFHNLQIIFFLSLALIYANLQFGYPNCVHAYNIKIAIE